jgi:hypothetical protein
MTAPSLFCGGRHGHDRMVFGFTTTYAISVYHHRCWEFEPRSGRGVQHYVIKNCQWLATGRWFSPGLPVSSTIKTDCHDIAEIVLKVALNTIKPINHPVSFLQDLKIEGMESIWIDILFPKTKPIIMGTCYRPTKQILNKLPLWTNYYRRF